MKKIMLSALLLSLPLVSYAQQAFTSPKTRQGHLPLR